MQDSQIIERKILKNIDIDVIEKYSVGENFKLIIQNDYEESEYSEKIA